MKIMLDEGAKMPTRAHPWDAGLDLYAPKDYRVPSSETVHSWGDVEVGSAIIDTGVHIELPNCTAGFLKSKSGLNVNYNITSEGVIDSGYTGSIKVKLYNHGDYRFQIEEGQKISQLVILPIITPGLELVDSLEETERGNGGFGSTGAFAEHKRK